LEQFRPGERDFNAGEVPMIGWDYGTTSGTGDLNANRYQLQGNLLGGSFVSITLVWDRQVTFASDTVPKNIYNSGDSFAPYSDDGINPPDDSIINDLSLYLVEKGGSIAQAVAASISSVGTVEHIFFQIPETGGYEFWVVQEDDDVGSTQDYAVAWWAMSAGPMLGGDFNNDGIVNAADLAVWQSNFGSGSAADADGDGDTDGNDFAIWQRNLGMTAATINSAAVPEPAALLLLALCAPLILRRRVAVFSEGSLTP
jgi:hypothetical protein